MLPHSDACERNKGPILAVLREYLAGRSQVLEIGSGTGQHAVHFAAHLTHLTWHPTERLDYLPDLVARVHAEGGSNIGVPTVLDVRQAIWPTRPVDAVFTANTLHIMSWGEVGSMFQGLQTALRPGGVVCIYGPFSYAGRHTAASNDEFDRFLRARDPDSGVRDLDAVRALAAGYGLTLSADHEMPANNRLVVFIKEPG